MSLKEDNYELTEATCEDCEEGGLWVNSFELVCDECGRVFRDTDRDLNATRNPAEDFLHRRQRYYSGKVKLAGGFTEAYPNADTERLSDDPQTISRPYK